MVDPANPQPDSDDRLGLPEHLQDRPPFGVCTACGRFTWAAEEVDEPCGLPQPNGLRCNGILEAVDPANPHPEVQPDERAEPKDSDAAVTEHPAAGLLGVEGNDQEERWDSSEQTPARNSKQSDSPQSDGDAPSASGVQPSARPANSQTRTETASALIEPASTAATRSGSSETSPTGDEERWPMWRSRRYGNLELFDPQHDQKAWEAAGWTRIEVKPASTEVQPSSEAGPTHAPSENTLRYIETMLRGDTDRVQVADYIADHVIPAARQSEVQLPEAGERDTPKCERCGVSMVKPRHRTQELEGYDWRCPRCGGGQARQSELQPEGDSEAGRTWTIEVCPQCHRQAESNEDGCCGHCDRWLGGEGTGDEDHTIEIEVVEARSLEAMTAAKVEACARLYAAESQVEQLRGERDEAKRELRQRTNQLGESDDDTDKLEAQVEQLREALKRAADDLGKAANQFASMRESQRAGHHPVVTINPERFEEKEAQARSALAHLDGKDE